MATRGRNAAEAPASAASVDDIERRLEAMIVAGAFAPGEHLNESALAGQFGVSRAPVREACRLLERSGLVNIRPHHGAFVRALELDEVVNLFDIRASLGRLAGESAAANITQRALAALRGMLDTLDTAAEAGDADRYVALNLEFHEALYAATGNARLAALDRAMGKELRLYRRHGLAFGGGLRVSNREHRDIVEALERGDRARAGTMLERHIEGGRDRFLRAMAASGRLVLQPSAGSAANG
ncbi:MAG: FCD domain-containing protein [Proteobacteria bacterium]|nr:FCD domain-containing protein [Pseudomonadota bacterium]